MQKGNWIAARERIALTCFSLGSSLTTSITIRRAFLYTLYTETPGRAFLEGGGGSKTSGCVFGFWSDIPLDNSEKHKKGICSRLMSQSACSPESQAQIDLILALAKIAKPKVFRAKCLFHSFFQLAQDCVPCCLRNLGGTVAWVRFLMFFCPTFPTRVFHPNSLVAGSLPWFSVVEQIFLWVVLGTHNSRDVEMGFPINPKMFGTHCFALLLDQLRRN